MKRVGNLWPQVIAFENLQRAARRAARGKRERPCVARFLARLEPELLELQRELEEDRYRPGVPVTFVIHDPKTRTIAAAPFRDRVVHHALIDPLEPLFDRRLAFESFACRRGKGTLAALQHARRLVRAHPWFLKLDIARCFESMRHDVVLGSVERIVKDRRVLRLFEVVVRRPGVERGLPIGSLTSQWLANLTLGAVDRLVKERLRVPGYVRYMDDFVLFDSARDRLREHLQVVRQFIQDELGLELKHSATLLAPRAHGLPFLGWRLFAGMTRLRCANLRRSRRRLERRRQEFDAGRLTEERYADCVRSVYAHLAQGNTLGLRTSWLIADEVRAPSG